MSLSSHLHCPTSEHRLRVILLLLLAWSTVSVDSSYDRPQSNRRSRNADESATWWSSSRSWWTTHDDDEGHDASSFTAEEADYVRHLLTFAFGIQQTPIGSVFTSPRDAEGSRNDAHLMPSVIAGLVERFKSLDLETLAAHILGNDEQLSNARTVLKKIDDARAAAGAAGRRDGDHLPSSNSDDVNVLIDWLDGSGWPWVPQANLSECSKDYSQFVDPITNRIWVIVRRQLCEAAPLACSQIPPVPNVTQSPWGRRMIDAMGKIPEGLSEIKLYFVGAYDMCNEMEVEYNLTISTNQTQYRQFNGQYCRLSIVPSFSGLNLNVTIPLPLQLGVCTPDTCSRSGVANYIMNDNKALAVILEQVFDSATIAKVYCGQEVDSETDIPLQVAVGIMLGCVILIIVSTIYDGCFRKQRLRRFLKSLPMPKDAGHRTSNADGSNTSTTGCSCSTDKSTSSECGLSSRDDQDCDNRVCSYELVKNMRRLKLSHRLELFLIGFSAYTNLRKIFSTRSKPGHLPELNGLRYLSYVWVILGQTYFLGPVYHENFCTANTFTMLRTYPREFKMQVVINFHIAGDTFLLISGILVTYWFLRRFEAGGRQLKIMTFVIYAVRKYWRVMPAIMGIVMFYTTTYRYLAEGPLFPTDIGDGDNCRLNWWVDLLMVQNLVRTEYLCLSWLFLVAVILQLQIAAIVVLVPLALKPIFGYIMVAVMWIAHIITTAILSHN